MSNQQDHRSRASDWLGNFLKNVPEKCPDPDSKSPILDFFFACISWGNEVPKFMPKSGELGFVLEGIFLASVGKECLATKVPISSPAKI